ncbi:serine hydrolase domain-containing protein [Endozoicomonas arenosclerae]|uniref:serine hydrolase domain-containing protein n=1 Tax=Endozoicomonas arenosclerae TaxID=1633495 RepID=UPI0007814CF7|nr:serine hydrolase [Endozoicomonas arenosclerae]
MKKQLLASLIGLSAASVQAVTYHPVDTEFVKQAAELNITQQNWDSGSAAKLTLRNAYRFTPYMEITKNDSFTHDLGKAKGLDLKRLRSKDLDGEYNLEVILRDRMNTESMVITRNGQLIDEYFWNGNDKNSTHLQMSISKSFTALAAAILAEEGKIDMSRPITDYLPELKASKGFSRATVQQVADMRSGIKIIFSEGKLWDDRMTQAQDWNGNNQYPELQSVLDFGQLVDAADEKEGTVYNYQCINTEMLGLVVERVAEKPLSEVIEERLWKRVGFENNAKWQSSRKGEIVASGGLNATTRDVNRMMYVLVNGGKNTRGEQIIPEKFIKNLMTGNEDVRNAWKQGSEYKLLPNAWYQDQIRVINIHGHKILAFLGIHGQIAVGEPETGIVISINSSQEERQAPRIITMAFESVLPTLLDAVNRQK